MSAPETNIEKQSKRHGGPLLGMAVGVGFALILLVGWLTWAAYNGDTPGDPEAVGPTGEMTTTD
ncbi:hypothetical protein [Vannielia sp.]|uniref:hypothetical protein n=1 Tax=Vannielia sp. TaxID=2813045 RepID=UPI0026242A38|nr:hypothetical protein [Vannielia sp.]MDF1873055.1 hypothetical protein [Vannielia sp.]